MNIERKIVIGLITSTEYIQQIAHVWDVDLLESSVSKRVATWCMEYYEKYNKAPGKDIQSIYASKADSLPEDIAEGIEEDYLPGLNEEIQDDPINLNYLLDQTYEFFTTRNLENHSEEIQGLLLSGELTEAENLALDYKPLMAQSATDLDLKSEVALTRIDKAFDLTSDNIIHFSGAMGELLNQHLRRGGFVALMSSEKRGKTFRLMEMSIRACRQRRKVAFFQAGDMTEDEMMMRVCINLSGKSNLKEYCNSMYEPIKDCIKNQLNTCDKEERECNLGVFEELTEKELRSEICLETILEAKKENKGYRTCRNCDEYKTAKGLGSTWVKQIRRTDPLTTEEAKASFEKFFTNKRQFKLSSYSNGSLSVKGIKASLDMWEKQDGFVPDLITIDYADLLVAEEKTDYRHQQFEIWKALRGLSQQRHALVLTATQADAKSYEKERLTMSNFSEDKRKYGQVTAMYGLNQDKNGREKELGIMRINEIVIREGAGAINRDVVVLQNLRRGKPFLGSYWI